MTSHIENHEPGPVGQSTAQPFDLARFARRNGTILGIISVGVLLWAFFVVAAPDTFLKPEIYKALMQNIPFFGVVALPLTMVVIAGEMDLSFPSVMAVGMTAFTVVVDNIAGEVPSNWNWELLLGLLACLAMGFVAGIINGLIVVYLRIPSLITTIGTMFFWRGAILVVTDARSRTYPVRGTAFREVLVGRIGGQIPAQMLWLVVVAVFIWLLLNRHRFGAHIYLIGDNENSARLMGVDVDRTRIMVFALCGTAAAFGGLLASMDVASFFTTLGEGYMMTTLAAVFLGGTSVFGGTGTIIGTFIGCFMIGAINPGIIAIGTIEIGKVVIKLSGFWTQLVYGLIIVASVAMHSFLRERME
jgi:simple sugar transport system permease protein